MLIRDMGVALPIGPESHTKIQYCLLESNEALALQAGNALQSLRRSRNRADYDLAAFGNFGLLKVQKSLAEARLTIDRLRLCREGAVGTRFRVKFRDYAANMLRLPVT